MIKSSNKRQRRRNRHRYVLRKAIPLSTTITFKIDTTELEAAILRFRERAIPAVAASISELIKLGNTLVLPQINRKDIAIDTGRLHSSYSCEATWAIKTEEQIESINDEVTAWTRRVERMEVVNYQIYIGDPSCKFNARSHLIQCAVNPSGKCGSCPDHENI